MKPALNPRDEMDQLLGLFFQLLDLSRDVERNREDYALCQDGGTLWYVFDENLVELFINPRDGRGRMTSLHAPQWSRAPERSALVRTYVAQTTLATAEYLLAGDLPGQDRQTIYMTEWHRREFINRVDSLKSRLVNRLCQASEKDIRERFAPVRELLRAFDRNPDGIESLISDRILAGDLASYSARNPTARELKSYLATRLSLAILAADEVVEPSEQLRRSVTAPLRYAFSTLHRSLPVASPKEKQAIADDAQSWMVRLRDHCARHGIKVVGRRDGPAAATVTAERRGQRSEGALWDDAKSIALVRWAAAVKSKTSLKQRLVFVTADQIVFDAYRDWYAGLSFKDPAYSEPFCFRRMTQFTPFFNLVSSGRVEGGEAYAEVFQDILQALEVMLLPLNLSRIASRAPEVVLTRMREKTALRPTEPGRIAEDPAYQPLVSALRQGGVAKYRAKLDLIIDRWRELERAALGRPNEQIQRRIQVAEAIEADLGPEGSRDAYRNYVTYLVKTLLSGSRKLSLPLAREFIDDWPEQSAREITRAPIALQLTVTTGKSSFAVGDILDERRAGATGPLLDEEGWTELYEHPALVFSIAAAHCLTARDWSNAQHFAEMALLEEMEDEVEADARARHDRRHEIKYLYALVNRFRMGEIGPPLTGEAFSRLERYYRLALAHLDECEAYHSGVETRQELRLMRALSERAALHLFFVSATNKWVRAAAAAAAMRRGSWRNRPDRDPEQPDLLDLDADPAAIEALERAEADLVACLAIDRQLPEIEEPARCNFRFRLQRQYYTNIATTGVFRALWSQPPDGAPPQLRPGAPGAVRRVRDILDRYGGAAHPLMRADVLAFLALGGDEAAAATLASEPVLAPNPGVLNLDIAIVDTLRDRADDFCDRGRAALLPVQAEVQ